MVRYGISAQGQQQLLLLQQHYAMMEHHLQQQQQRQHSPASPSQKTTKDEQNLRSRQINCVYLTDAKPATFSFVNPEAVALCTTSSNLPTVRSSCGAASTSPTVLHTPSGGNTVANTPPPAPATTTTRTSFMISDILDSSPNSRCGRRTCSTTSTVSAPDEGSVAGYGACNDDPTNGRDSPRSVVSDDAEARERENREDSTGASDSDVERSGQGGRCSVIANLPMQCCSHFFFLLPSRKLSGDEIRKEKTTKSTVLSWPGV